MIATDLPGLLRVLVERDLLDRAALAPLVAALAAIPDALLFRVLGDERIDQIGWPVAHDLDLALLACTHTDLDRSHPLVADTLAAARRVLADPITDSPPIARAQLRLVLLGFLAAGAPLEQVLALAPSLGGAPDPDREPFLAGHTAWALAHPRTVTTLTHLARTTLGVVHGWFAYHAHRRYPSAAAEAAADLVAHLLPTAGPDLLPALLARAEQLATTGSITDRRSPG